MAACGGDGAGMVWVVVRKKSYGDNPGIANHMLRGRTDKDAKIRDEQDKFQLPGRVDLELDFRHNLHVR